MFVLCTPLLWSSDCQADMDEVLMSLIIQNSTVQALL